MDYHVIVKIGEQKQKSLADFVDLKDAKAFIQTKKEWDEKMNAVATEYSIYQGKQLLESYQWDPDAPKTGSGSGFHPTPAPITPRPPGTPPTLRDEDED